MFSSVRFRLWLTYALVVGAMLLIAGSAVFFYLLRNPVIDRREVQRLRLISNLVIQRNQALALLLRDPSPDNIHQALKRIDSLSSARVALYSFEGEILGDSRSGSMASLPRLSSLQQNSEDDLPVFRDANQRQWIFVLSPLENNYYFLAATPRIRNSITALMRDEFVNFVVRGALVALVLSLVMAFWIAHWITNPLQNMSRSARAISDGDFHPIPVKGPSEVQSLALTFNEMGQKVQASQRSQRDFIANVSHDMKTPLTSIQGFAQAILDGVADDPQALRQAAEVICDESGRMHRMVNDLLELARLDSGVVQIDRQSVDLVKILTDVVDKFIPQSRLAQVDLQFTADPDLPLLQGDPDRLAQVFTNLVENAIKYTPAGGQVKVSAQLSGELFEITITDTGPGIPEDQLPRIFERFYQTDKSRSRENQSGFGLGLAIAREIVQLHGGAISAHNRNLATLPGVTQPSPGSLFIVRLPLTRSDNKPLLWKK